MTRENYEKMKNSLEKWNSYYFSNMTNFIKSGKERCGIDLHLEWDDKNLIDYIDFKLPEITYSYKNNHYNSDPNDRTLEYVNKINTLVKKFNERDIDFFAFTSQSAKLLEQLKESKENSKLFYVYDHDYESLYIYAKSLSIYGFGGMGKSHFLWECQKQIQNKKKYQSLFVYGKFYKNNSILWDEIIEYSKNNEFLLVVDGINEINSLDIRKHIYDKISQIKECKYARVIVSYRTHSLLGNIKSKSEAEYLDDLMYNTLNFAGVNFESSLNRLIEVYKVDASYFYNILYSNNAMQIRMLIECDILNDKQLYDEFKRSPIKSLTFIYERFIERSCTRIWKQETGTIYWKEIKNLAEIMYYNNQSFFKKDEISNTIKDKDRFVTDLKNGGFIYEYGDKYYLSWEQLSNSIIARTFYKDIKGKNRDDIVLKLKGKIKNFRQIAQALILVLVEKYEKHFEDFVYVLRNVVDDEFELSTETLLSIIINDRNLRENFQNMWDIELEYALSNFAGIPNRIFNAESYVYNKVLNSNIQYIKPSYSLNTFDIQRKLKNNLYNLNGKHLIKSNLEEFLKYAIVCLFIQNTDIIELAEKTIYDIIEFNDFDAFDVLNECLNRINSKWVKRSLLDVIINLSQEKRTKYSSIVQNVFNDTGFYNAKVLVGACKNLRMPPFYYVQLLKEDLFKSYKPVMALEQKKFNEFDSFGGIIWEIRNYKKYYSLNMEYYNDLKLNFDLVDQPKEQIIKYNEIANKLVEKFNMCDCKIDIHTRSFESLLETIPHMESKTIDKKELFWGFICHLKSTFEYYKVTDDELEEYQRGRRNYPYNNRYSNSRIHEIVEICVEEYVGSLMCNYFQNDREVVYWGNKIYLGYIPIEYSPDRDFNIHTPIRVFNENTQYLDESVIERIESLSPYERNEKWANDLSNALNNVVEIIKPYKDKDGIEWVLLSCHINNRTYSNNKIRNNYDLPYDSEDCIILSGTCQYKSKKHLILDRYKTIEFNNYKGPLNDYCLDIDDFCYSIDVIKENSDLWGSQNIVLPPSKVLSYFKLKFDIRAASFCNEKGEPIILCNCFDSEFYKENIVHSVYIRKDYFDNVKNKLDLFYYCYVERYSADIGHYSDQSDTHLLVKNGKIKQKIRNGIMQEYKFKPAYKCKKCRVYKEYIKDMKLSKKEMLDLEILFKDYSD